MYVAQAVSAEHLGGVLDAFCHFLGRLHLVILDVDHSQADPDFWIQACQVFQFQRVAARHLQHHVVGMQEVHEPQQLVVVAALDGLAAIIAETQVHCGYPPDRIQHQVDRFRHPYPVFGVPGQVGLVHLHDIGLQPGSLVSQHTGDSHGQGAAVAVVAVEQHLGEHVWTGEGELGAVAGQLQQRLAGLGQVECSRADRANHDASRLGAVRHTGLRAELQLVSPGKLCIDPAHLADEVVNHAVGLGMVEVVAVQLAVGDHIDARQLLGAHHHQGGIAQVRARGRDAQPVGNRVAADDGG